MCIAGAKRYQSTSSRKTVPQRSVSVPVRPDGYTNEKKKETTRIFFMADTILRSVAVRSGRSILLRFDTANSRLKQWILSNEDELGFDTVDPRSDRAYRITVEKMYTSPT